MGERLPSAQHTGGAALSGRANGTEIQRSSADSTLACWLIFAPQDRMVDVDVGRKSDMNCVEEHDTCPRPLLSRHRNTFAAPRSPAKPTVREDTQPHPPGLSQRCSLPRVVFGAARWALAAAAGCYSPRPTAFRSVQRCNATDSWALRTGTGMRRL